MFTGIIEALGRVLSTRKDGNNLELYIESPFTSELKVDQSVAHLGVCLTVTKIDKGGYYVTAIHETLERTNLGLLKTGDLLNLERCMKLQDRVDGHIVQGHVDMVAELSQIEEEKGSWRLTFTLQHPHEGLLTDKGSVTINGVSLTVVNPQSQTFSVAIIPYTWSHTQFQQAQAGDRVNIEFDILGKYVRNMLQQAGHI